MQLPKLRLMYRFVNSQIVLSAHGKLMEGGGVLIDASCCRLAFAHYLQLLFIYAISAMLLFPLYYIPILH